MEMYPTIIASFTHRLTAKEDYAVKSGAMAEFFTSGPVIFGRGDHWAIGSRGQLLRAGPGMMIRIHPDGPSAVNVVGIEIPVQTAKTVGGSKRRTSKRSKKKRSKRR